MEIEGETFTFSLVVPVFMKAVEMREEAGKLFRVLAELDSLKEAYADQVVDEHEAKLVSNKANEVEVAVLRFTVKWLKETCSQCTDMTEEHVANILRMAGNDSPLVAALMELAVATNNPAVEGLGDLPF